MKCGGRNVEMFLNFENFVKDLIKTFVCSDGSDGRFRKEMVVLACTKLRRL